MPAFRSTNGKWIIVDSEDWPAVRRFRWHVSFYPDGRVCGVATTIYGKDVALSHFLLGTTPQVGAVADHVDGNAADNRQRNLRWCNRRQNNQNKRPRSGNTSGVTGVSFYEKTGGWRARIKNGEGQDLARIFSTKEAAIAQRLAWEKEYFGEFAPSLCRKTVSA